MYVTVWVDALLIACADEQEIVRFEADIGAAFAMKDLGQAHFCLGMRFRFGDGWVSLDQERHIVELLERHGLASCNPAVTPLPPGTELCKPGTSTAGKRSQQDELLPEDKAGTYREIVGARCTTW